MLKQFGLAAIAALALAGCNTGPKTLDITDAYIVLNANPRAPSAAYFTITGGATEERLLSVISPVIIRTELHESMGGGHHDMATMKKLDGGIAIPAGATVKFEPGGKHVMLYDLNPAVTPDKAISMTFTFASGTQLEKMVDVRKVGAKS